MFPPGCLGADASKVRAGNCTNLLPLVRAKLLQQRPRVCRTPAGERAHGHDRGERAMAPGHWPRPRLAAMAITAQLPSGPQPGLTSKCSPNDASTSTWQLPPRSHALPLPRLRLHARSLTGHCERTMKPERRTRREARERGAHKKAGSVRRLVRSPPPPPDEKSPCKKYPPDALVQRPPDANRRHGSRQ